MLKRLLCRLRVHLWTYTDPDDGYEFFTWWNTRTCVTCERKDQWKDGWKNVLKGKIER